MKENEMKKKSNIYSVDLCSYEVRIIVSLNRHVSYVIDFLCSPTLWSLSHNQQTRVDKPIAVWLAQNIPTTLSKSIDRSIVITDQRRWLRHKFISDASQRFYERR